MDEDGTLVTDKVRIRKRWGGSSRPPEQKVAHT